MVEKKYTQKQAQDLASDFKLLRSRLNEQYERIQEYRQAAGVKYSDMLDTSKLKRYMALELDDQNLVISNSQLGTDIDELHRMIYQAGLLEEFYRELEYLFKTLDSHVKGAEELAKYKDNSILWKMHPKGWKIGSNEQYSRLKILGSDLNHKSRKIADGLDQASQYQLSPEYTDDLQYLAHNRREATELKKGRLVSNKPAEKPDNVLGLLSQASSFKQEAQVAEHNLEEFKNNLLQTFLKGFNSAPQASSFENWIKRDIRPNMTLGYDGVVDAICKYFDVKVHSDEFLGEISNIHQIMDEFCIAYENLTPEDWLFSDNKRKDKLKSVYQTWKSTDLERIQNLSEKERSAVLQAKQSSPEESLEMFAEDKDKYKPLAEWLLTKRSDSNQAPALILSLAERLRKLEEEFYLPEKKIEDLKPLVEEQVKKLTVPILIDQMMKIPVSECSKVYKGLRVKSLADEGYQNLASIYFASAGSLSNVKGITYQTAKNLKSYANETFKSLQEDTPFRIEKLEDNENSRILVSYLHSILRLQEIGESLYEVRHGEWKIIKEYCEDLLQIRLGLRALFLSDEELVAAKEKYRAIQEYLESSPDGKTIRSLSDRVSSVINTDPKHAFQDYSKHPLRYITLMDNLFPDLVGSDKGNYGLPDELATEIFEQEFFPDGLKVNLRKYQIWGVKYALHQQRVLLGDDMGLGKTAQAIGTMVSLRNTGMKNFMVICPLSVLVNWVREIGQFSHLRPITIYGKYFQQGLTEWQKTGGVAVTTYETVKKIENPSDFTIDMLVVDEAHYVKNPDTARSKAVSQLAKQAERTLFMTGTPIENNVQEMINLVDMIQPTIASKIKNMGDMRAKSFRDGVAPVYFRRKKEAVLSELPDKIESEEWCEMNSQEREVYEQKVLARNYQGLRQLSFDVGDMALSSKASRLRQIVLEAKANDSRVIVFSFFRNTINQVMTMLGDICYGPIHGSVSSGNRQEIIDEFSESPAGSVLVCQIQSGGTGLNIQAANVIILCEPQFKPSVEQQAIGRAYRMGQTKSNVLVYRLLCSNTIEERMMEVLAEKQKIFDDYADISSAVEQIQGKRTSETDMRDDPQIDNKTFYKLVDEEIEAIKKRKNI